MKETVKLNKETYDKMVEDIRMLSDSYAIAYHDDYGTEYLSKEYCKDLADAVSWGKEVAKLRDRIEVLEAEKAQLEVARELDKMQVLTTPARGIKLFGFRITREK